MQFSNFRISMDGKNDSVYGKHLMCFGGKKAIFKYEWDLREVGVYAKAKLLRHSR